MAVELLSLTNIMPFSSSPSSHLHLHRSTASSSRCFIIFFHQEHRSTASSSSSTNNIFSLLHHHLHLHQPLSTSQILFVCVAYEVVFIFSSEKNDESKQVQRLNVLAFAVSEKNDESKQVQRSNVLAFAVSFVNVSRIGLLLFQVHPMPSFPIGADAEYDKIVLDSVPSGSSGVVVSASVDAEYDKNVLDSVPSGSSGVVVSASVGDDMG
ncbi:hypothetical protein QVD17_30708 [Tagetes erecta]|uniref:Uncharacterized protein n=1 Tax=Tagetes erecta TaxID=13708 RepID=A0AAD8K645_TARER|nr:hypothetical protein QVD17_30708 [Tagetes erecta]